MGAWWVQAQAQLSPCALFFLQARHCDAASDGLLLGLNFLHWGQADPTGNCLLVPPCNLIPVPGSAAVSPTRGEQQRSSSSGDGSGVTAAVVTPMSAMAADAVVDGEHILRLTSASQRSRPLRSLLEETQADCSCPRGGGEEAPEGGVPATACIASTSSAPSAPSAPAKGSTVKGKEGRRSQHAECPAARGRSTLKKPRRGEPSRLDGGGRDDSMSLRPFTPQAVVEAPPSATPLLQPRRSLGAGTIPADEEAHSGGAAAVAVTPVPSEVAVAPDAGADAAEGTVPSRVSKAAVPSDGALDSEHSILSSSDAQGACWDPHGLHQHQQGSNHAGPSPGSQPGQTLAGSSPTGRGRKHKRQLGLHIEGGPPAPIPASPPLLRGRASAVTSPSLPPGAAGEQLLGGGRSPLSLAHPSRCAPEHPGWVELLHHLQLATTAEVKECTDGTVGRDGGQPPPLLLVSSPLHPQLGQDVAPHQHQHQHQHQPPDAVRPESAPGGSLPPSSSGAHQPPILPDMEAAGGSHSDPLALPPANTPEQPTIATAHWPTAVTMITPEAASAASGGRSAAPSPTVGFGAAGGNAPLAGPSASQAPPRPEYLSAAVHAAGTQAVHARKLQAVHVVGAQSGAGAEPAAACIPVVKQETGEDADSGHTRDDATAAGRVQSRGIVSPPVTSSAPAVSLAHHALVPVGRQQQPSGSSLGTEAALEARARLPEVGISCGYGATPLASAVVTEGHVVTQELPEWCTHYFLMVAGTRTGWVLYLSRSHKGLWCGNKAVSWFEAIKVCSCSVVE